METKVFDHMEVHLRTELLIAEARKTAPCTAQKNSCDSYMENSLQPLWIASLFSTLFIPLHHYSWYCRIFLFLCWLFFWLNFFEKTPKTPDVQLWLSIMSYSATPSHMPAPPPALYLYILGFTFLCFTAFHILVFCPRLIISSSATKAKRFPSGDWKSTCPFSMLYWLSKHNSWILLVQHFTCSYWDSWALGANLFSLVRFETGWHWQA